MNAESSHLKMTVSIEKPQHGCVIECHYSWSAWQSVDVGVSVCNSREQELELLSIAQ